MFQSLPFTPRRIEATESRLKAVYDAAKLGLKGDTLALASGMLPSEYRQLTQLDPIVELAALKGKADGELALSKVMHDAALSGDAKVALEILKHQHGWVAKQAISIDVDQRISITGALAEAQKRVLEVIIDESPKRLASNEGSSDVHINAGQSETASYIRPRHGSV